MMAPGAWATATGLMSLASSAVKTYSAAIEAVANCNAMQRSPEAII